MENRLSKWKKMNIMKMGVDEDGSKKHILSHASEAFDCSSIKFNVIPNTIIRCKRKTSKLRRNVRIEQCGTIFIRQKHARSFLIRRALVREVEANMLCLNLDLACSAEAQFLCSVNRRKRRALISICESVAAKWDLTRADMSFCSNPIVNSNDT